MYGTLWIKENHYTSYCLSGKCWFKTQPSFSDMALCGTIGIQIQFYASYCIEIRKIVFKAPFWHLITITTMTVPYH